MFSYKLLNNNCSKHLYRNCNVLYKHFSISNTILSPFISSSKILEDKCNDTIINKYDKYSELICRRYSTKSVNDLEAVAIKNEESDIVSEQGNSISREIAADSEVVDDNNEFYKVDEYEITKGDPDLLKKLEMTMLEVETFRQGGYDIPSRLKTEGWKELLFECKSRSAKIKYLRYLFLTEVRKKNDLVRRQRQREKRLEELKERLENVNPDHPRYGIGGNTIFLRIADTKMNYHANNRLIQAMQFGQDFVIDCSYDSYMSKKEMAYCAKQLMYVFAENRNSIEPFNLHFTSANRNSHLIKTFEKFIPTLYDLDFPINITDKSYLDFLPKEKLVYLTPHCRTDLKEFNHDDIYIIGGIVDRENCEPLSLAKAKSESLRMAKFPLDKYLLWALGTKSLTLDQCLKIMLDLRDTGNWEKALVHVPRRKLVMEERENEKLEEKRDKSMKFGQTYVTSHEWGLKRQKDQFRKHKAAIGRMDLRTLIKMNKKK